jgi:hypothetical protein
MLLVMTSIILLLRVMRIEWNRRAVRRPLERVLPMPAAPTLASPVLQGSLR